MVIDKLITLKLKCSDECFCTKSTKISALWYSVHTVLLEYFVGEKPLRMSQVSRKFNAI